MGPVGDFLEYVKVVFFLVCYFGCCTKFEDSHYSKRIEPSLHIPLAHQSYPVKKNSTSQRDRNSESSFLHIYLSILPKKNSPKHEDLGKGGKEASTSSLAPTVSSRDI